MVRKKPQLPLIAAILCLFHVLSRVCLLLRAIRGSKTEPTSLTHGEIFVKLLLEGSNATNYLRWASQPSRQFDRWLWPQQTWGPSLGWHVRLPLKGEVDGLRVWMQGSFSDCILYCTSLRQAWTGNLSWWHRSVRPLRICLYTVSKNAHTHSDISPLMKGFTTCFLLGLRAPPYCYWAVNECSFLW